jgi:hypothetical protein
VLSLEDYQELIARASIMVWRTDATGRCAWLNEPALAFTDRALEGDGTDGWTAGIHPRDLDRCLALFRAHHTARAPFALEYRLRRVDGVYRSIVDRGAPRWDAAGAFVGFVGSRVDAGGGLVAGEPEPPPPRPGRRPEELLPICVTCKRVRDERGRWHRVERYLEERGSAAFTHTFCETCERDVE